MLGLLAFLAVAVVMGTVVGYLLGLGSMGPWWHAGIGVAGQLLALVLLLALPLPYWIRISLNGVSIFPIWGTVGTLMVGLVVAIVRAGGEGAG